MHALIVVSHPSPKSLTHSVAGQIAEGISQAGDGHSFEIADLAAEGFDPRFKAADITSFETRVPPPADVLAEQARIDRADALVLVYPVYWWSMPALLKGWIDRVFTGGWAHDDRPGAKDRKKLGRLRVHLVAIGGADMRTYARHGYFGAMKTQIDHGIFDYCGAKVVRSELLLIPEAEDQSVHLEAARIMGQTLFAQPAPCGMASAA